MIEFIEATLNLLSSGAKLSVVLLGMLAIILGVGLVAVAIYFAN
jgi:hypothetical protein